MKKILFVCMSNLRRSKMAEAIFTEFSGTKAESAGIEPAEKPEENVIAALKEIGITPEDAKPKKVTQSMLEEAGKIITFNCADKLPEKYKSKIENWDIGSKRGMGTKPPEKSLDDVRELRDQINKKVEQLVKRLKKEQ